AARPVGQRAGVRVAEILKQLHGRTPRRRRAIGARERAEVVVEGVVLLDNDVDVPNRGLNAGVAARGAVWPWCVGRGRIRYGRIGKSPAAAAAPASPGGAAGAAASRVIATTREKREIKCAGK